AAFGRRPAGRNQEPAPLLFRARVKPAEGARSGRRAIAAKPAPYTNPHPWCNCAGRLEVERGRRRCWDAVGPTEPWDGADASTVGWSRRNSGMEPTEPPENPCLDAPFSAS